MTLHVSVVIQVPFFAHSLDIRPSLTVLGRILGSQRAGEGELTPDSETCDSARRSRHVLGDALVVAGVGDVDVTNDEHGAVVRHGVLAARRQRHRLTAALPAHLRPRLAGHEAVERHRAAGRRLGVSRWSIDRRRYCTITTSPSRFVTQGSEIFLDVCY